MTARGLGRRSLLGGTAGLAALVAGGGLAGCATAQLGALRRSRVPLPAPYTVPLTVPRTLDADGATVTARVADVEILPGRTTRVLGYDGTFPGPTLVARRGRPVTVTHVNQLPVPMVVHLHGGAVEAAHDGFPTDLVLPQDPAARARHGGMHGAADPRAVVTTGSRAYRYALDQPAATLWYHDHTMDFTGPMVYRGLAGMFLVHDDVEDDLPLPTGDRDLPLVVADRSFDADGQLDYPAHDASMTGDPGVVGDAAAGVLGDVVLVNGRPWPVHDVDAARHRLRLLNASNARRYRFVLDPPPPSGPAFVQVGSDGGLLPAPVGHDGVTLAAGERADVVVDFAAWPVGTRVTLRNALGDGGTREVVRFVVARRAGRDPARVPAVLAPDADPHDPGPVTGGRVHRTFRFRRGSTATRQQWLVNDLPFDPSRLDAVVPAGTTEIWRFASDVAHPVHVHLARMRVLRRGTGGPGPHDAGIKDTVDLRAAEHVDVAVRFPPLPGRYVLHCHNLEHEDMMMMSAFGVTA